MRTFVRLLTCCMIWLGTSGFSCGPTVQDCTLQKDCASNERCVKYRCQKLDYCSSDKDCKSPRTCVNNQCTAPAKGCNTDKDCSSPRVCKQKKCVDPPPVKCQKDTDCRSPRVCKQQVCVDPPAKGCQKDTDCKSPQVCKQQKCVTPPPPKCQKNSDCKKGEICNASGKCEIQQSGLCRLNASPSSLYFNTQKVGEVQTKTITLSNTGNGNCVFEKITLSPPKGTSGTFSVVGESPKSLAAGASAKMQIKFTVKAASGNTQSYLEFVSKGIAFKKINLNGYIKPDQTLPSKGWAIAHIEDIHSNGFVGGCFWKDGSFVAASQGAFSRGTLNMGFGNVLRTSDNGANWKCDNCVSGRTWPRTAHYELVDMRITGMSCTGGRGYAYGTFEINGNPAPAEAPTLYMSTGKSWTAVKDKKQNLSRFSITDKLYSMGSSWFKLTSRSLLQKVAPQADGTLMPAQFLYMGWGQKDRFTILDFSFHNNVGLLVGYQMTWNGTSRREVPIIRINTNGLQIPPPKTQEEAKKIGQYWPHVKSPCTTCKIGFGYAIDKNTLLLSTTETNQQLRKVTIRIWRTENRGLQWKSVYSYTQKGNNDHMYAGGMAAQVSSSKLFIVLGSNHFDMGSAQAGALLESKDGGKTFQEVKLSTLGGKKFHTQPPRMPALSGLAVSSDKKTVFAYGKGVILRWKP